MLSRVHSGEWARDVKSSTGQYWEGLDQIRGVAALLVVVWHFAHRSTGDPVPFEQAPLPLISIFEEGHVGVSLFMVLSGYLFTKLLAGRDLIFSLFLWNRAVRLFPLLILSFALWGLRTWLTGGDVEAFLWSLPTGFVLPTWPNGGWSIAVELHFYLLLPVLLVILRHEPWLMLLVVALFMAVRTAIFANGSEGLYYGYFTIIGRIDQFALGMLAFACRDRVTPRVAGMLAAAFVAYQWGFNHFGGYHGLADSAIWIVNPTIEAIACAAVVAWYDAAETPIRGAAGGWLTKAGEYSYSIYLLHMFFVPSAAKFIHHRVMDISDFYLALPWALASFAAMIMVGHVSYTWIEKPFERFRVRYTRTRKASGEPMPAAAEAISR